MRYETMWGIICADIIESPNKDIVFNYIRDDGHITKSNMRFWFSKAVNEEEIKILNELSGKVLDLACGFGRHLNYIKHNRNVKSYLGVEISQTVVDYNLLNNIPCICSDMMSFISKTKEKYDSILIMGNSIAECGSIDTIKLLINGAIKALNDRGRLVVSYKDVSETTDLVHKRYQEKNRLAGEYDGLVKVNLEYNGNVSENKQLCYIKKADWKGVLNQENMTTIYENFYNKWHYIVLEKWGEENVETFNNSFD